MAASGKGPKLVMVIAVLTTQPPAIYELLVS
jgi:hypothetical protein